MTATHIHDCNTVMGAASVTASDREDTVLALAAKNMQVHFQRGAVSCSVLQCVAACCILAFAAKSMHVHF